MDPKLTTDEQREKEKLISKATVDADKGRKTGCGVAVGVFVLLAIGFGSMVGETGIIIILVIAIVAGIVVAFVNKSNREQAASNAAQIAESQQASRRKSMENMMTRAKSEGFVFSKSVVNMQNTCCLALDSANQKFLVKVDSAWKILPFGQLVSYELCRDGSSIVSGNAGGALVGGLLFGAVGAVAGAAGPRNVDKYCSELYISIVDKAAQRYRIPLVTERISENSADYRVAIERARDMLSILDAVSAGSKEMKTSEQPSERAIHAIETPQPVSEGLSDETVRALKNYKELLDSGIITQEEFDNKKHELLNSKKI